MVFRLIQSIKPAINRLVGLESKIKMSKTKKKPIVWIDCEMTGLDLKKDRIMEIACLVTDSQLNPLADGINLVVHQPDSLLLSMDTWCTKTHTSTGLVKACQESTITEQQAETQILDYMKKYVECHEAPLAGNTIYMDRLFLREQMPRIDKYLHYRVIDVSTVKELCQRWNADVYAKIPPKKLVHRALDDILESIEELRYYRSFMFTS